LLSRGAFIAAAGNHGRERWSRRQWWKRWPFKQSSGGGFVLWSNGFGGERFSSSSARNDLRLFRRHSRRKEREFQGGVARDLHRQGRRADFDVHGHKGPLGTVQPGIRVSRCYDEGRSGR